MGFCPDEATDVVLVLDLKLIALLFYLGLSCLVCGSVGQCIACFNLNYLRFYFKFVKFFV